MAVLLMFRAFGDLALLEEIRLSKQVGDPGEPVVVSQLEQETFAFAQGLAPPSGVGLVACGPRSAHSISTLSSLARASSRLLCAY